MRHSEIKILLEKINTIYEAISEAPKQVSAIEKDLFLQYIRALYDAALMQEENVEQFRPTERIEAKPAQSNKQEEKPPEIELKEEADTKEPSEDHETPAVTHPEFNAEDLDSSPAAENDEDENEMDVLFDLKTGSDISDMLSQSSISDIGRHLGINDRILIVNELFGGRKDAFDEAIGQLNECNNEAEARKLIGREFAREFNWTDEHRLDTAQSFIRLVMRKFK